MVRSQPLLLILLGALSLKALLTVVEPSERILLPIIDWEFEFVIPGHYRVKAFMVWLVV